MICRTASDRCIVTCIPHILEGMFKIGIPSDGAWELEMQTPSADLDYVIDDRDLESDDVLMRHVREIKDRADASAVIDKAATASLKLPDSGVVDERV